VGWLPDHALGGAADAPNPLIYALFTELPRRGLLGNSLADYRKPIHQRSQNGTLNPHRHGLLTQHLEYLTKPRYASLEWILAMPSGAPPIGAFAFPEASSK
jgi:hypothetical protein